MSVINVVSTGVGGAGTSFIAWWLAQYFRFFQENPYCADISLCPTFARYSGLEVDYIDIYNCGEPFSQFNLRSLDIWVDRVLTQGRPCVLDVSASSFLPFFSYVQEADVFGLLKESGLRVIVHVPITGDDRQNASVSCLKSMLEWTQADFVAWHNDFHGPVDAAALASLETGARCLGTVKIERNRSSTFGRDILDVMMAELTIEEALSRPEFGVMPRRRLSILRQQMFEQLAAIPALSPSKRLLSSPLNIPLSLGQDRSFAKAKRR